MGLLAVVVAAGITLSPKQVEEATRLAKERGLTNVEFKVGREIGSWCGWSDLVVLTSIQMDRVGDKSSAEVLIRVHSKMVPHMVRAIMSLWCLLTCGTGRHAWDLGGAYATCSVS